MTKKRWKKLLALAKEGNKNAQYELGSIYEDGLQIGKKTIIKSNPTKALEWYIKSHKSGNSNATVRYADYLSEGKHCTKNLRQAINLYKSEIKKGSYTATANLAKTYCHENKWKDAILLYKTIKKEFKINPIELAYCYYYGLGVEQDKSTAMKLFKTISMDKSKNKNCEFDINDANYYLGLLYLEGKVIKQSISKARKFFTLANIDGDHSGAFEILRLIGKQSQQIT